MLLCLPAYNKNIVRLLTAIHLYQCVYKNLKIKNTLLNRLIEIWVTRNTSHFSEHNCNRIAKTINEIEFILNLPSIINNCYSF